MPGIRWSDMITWIGPGRVEDRSRASVPAGAGDDPVVEPEQVVDRAEDLRLVVDHQERRACDDSSTGYASARERPSIRWTQLGSLPGVEALDERHLVARVVVPHLVDHPLADQEAEAAGAEAELLADVEVA